MAGELTRLMRAWRTRTGEARAVSRLFLAASVLLVLAVVLLIWDRFQRGNLFPPAESRHDVTEVYVAPMRDVCPDGVDGLRSAAFARCTEELTLETEARPAAFHRLLIPSVDETVDAPVPSMRLAAQQQGLEEIKTLIDAKEPMVIGFRVPAKLFAPNSLGSEHHVLVLNGIQDARLCWQGTCPYVLSRYEQLALTFPLVTQAPSRAGETAMIDVYLFAKDSHFPVGLVLTDGLFVARQSDLFVARRYYPLAAYGRGIMLSALFIGLFLMAFGFAAIWSEFLDYASFCYFAGAFAMLSLWSEATYLSPDNLAFWYRGAAWTWFNIAIAATLFAFASTRARGRTLLAVLGVGQAAALGYVTFMLPAHEPALAMLHLKLVRPFMSWAIVIVPPAIAWIGALRCLAGLRRQRKGPLSARLDFRRRMVEQSLHGTLLFLVGLSFLSVFSGDWAKQLKTTQFAGTGGLWLVAIFGVVVYHSTAKLAKTHFRTDGQSEAVKLKGRMTADGYRAWLAEPREGVMLQIDVKNSSVATSMLQSDMHLLMNRLSAALRSAHERMGYHWVVAKRNGDEWIVILSRRLPTLAEDLEQIVLATRQAAPLWERIVRGMAAESSLHINVFALTSYSLSASAAKEARSHEGETVWDVIDFTSAEANYLMKHARKGRTAVVTVGCQASLVLPSLVGLATDVMKVSKLIAGAPQGSSEAAFEAEKLGLVLLEVPVRDRPSGNMAPIEPLAVDTGADDDGSEMAS